jgi:nitronate monooxygenase
MRNHQRAHPWKESRAAKALGIDYPIVQGPFGGLSSASLVVQVSNAGALGSCGALNLSPAQIVETIQTIREGTSRPFAVNLWVSTLDEEASQTTPEQIRRKAEWMHAYFAGLGLAPPPIPELQPGSFEAQVKALIDARPPVASFICGIPPAEILQECRRVGIVTIGTATTEDEARAIADAGMDLVVASGLEGGGHRGSFLEAAEASLTGTFALLPRVADQVSIPVIAAGGIADARGIVAALVLGAEAVQIGTAFLVCEGSGIASLHREALFSSAAKRTVLSRHFTGRLARGLRNRFAEDMERSGDTPLPYPLQRALLRPYSQEALRQGRGDLVTMWAGQAAPLLQHTTVAALMQELIEETNRTFERFSL